MEGSGDARASFLSARKRLHKNIDHKLKELDVLTFQQLVKAEDRESFESILKPLLVPRVVGTENHTKVKNRIKKHMSGLGWAVETDSFQNDTPHGAKSFENIIATLNPSAPRRLVLAAHYDSKYSEDDSFIGATDSAVPCAMLLHLATTLQKMLTEHKSTPHNVTLQFIFFDGEEAFESWTPTDSLYGSRHLATKWGNTKYPEGNQDGTTELHRMDMMVLLDLLGCSMKASKPANILPTLKRKRSKKPAPPQDPKLYSFFQETSHWHKALVKIEKDLKTKEIGSGTSDDEPIFESTRSNLNVEDDHTPFHEKGVDILLVIPSPFPSVWHTTGDNYDSLDFLTIQNLNKVFRVFVAKYLHLNLIPEN